MLRPKDARRDIVLKEQYRAAPQLARIISCCNALERHEEGEYVAAERAARVQRVSCRLVRVAVIHILVLAGRHSRPARVKAALRPRRRALDASASFRAPFVIVRLLLQTRRAAWHLLYDGRRFCMDVAARSLREAAPRGKGRYSFRLRRDATTAQCGKQTAAARHIGLTVEVENGREARR